MSKKKKSVAPKEEVIPVSDSIIEKKKISPRRLLALFFGSFLLAACCVWVTSSFLDKNTVALGGNKSINKNTEVVFSGEKLDPFMLVALMDAKKNIVIADLRSEADYKKGHIRDAKQFVAEEFESQYKKEKSVNKNTLIVLYSNTQYSTDASVLAERLRSKGYRAVSLAVGWNEWRHFSTFWVPESQWNSFAIDNYIEPRLDL